MSDTAAAILVWFGAHPEITTGIIGAFVTFFLGPKTEEDYAAMGPRLSAFVRLIKGALPDTPKVTSALVQLLTGKRNDLNQ